MIQTIILSIKAKPSARQTKFEVVGDEIIASIAAQPVDGEANQELIRSLAKTLKLTQKQIEVKVGASGRNKLVKVTSEYSKEEILNKLNVK